MRQGEQLSRRRQKKKKKKTRSVIIGGSSSKYGFTKLLQHKDVVHTLEKGWANETTLDWRPGLNLPDVYKIHAVNDRNASALRKRRRQLRAWRQGEEEELAAAGGYRATSAGPGGVEAGTLPRLQRQQRERRTASRGSRTGTSQQKSLDALRTNSNQQSTPWRVLPVSAAESASARATARALAISTMSPTVESILKRPVTVIREIPAFPKQLSDFLAAQQHKQSRSFRESQRAPSRGEEDQEGGKQVQGPDHESLESTQSAGQQGVGEETEHHDGRVSTAGAVTEADWLTQNVFRAREEARAALEQQRLQDLQQARHDLAVIVSQAREQYRQHLDNHMDSDAQTNDDEKGGRETVGEGEHSGAERRPATVRSAKLGTEMRRALDVGVNPHDPAMEEASALLRALIEVEEQAAEARAKRAEELLRDAEDALLQQIARSQSSRCSQPLVECMEALLAAGGRHDNMVYSAANSLRRVLEAEEAREAARMERERLAELEQAVGKLLRGFQSDTGMPSEDLLLWRDPPEAGWLRPSRRPDAAQTEGGTQTAVGLVETGNEKSTDTAGDDPSGRESGAAAFAEPRSSWHERILQAYNAAAGGGVPLGGEGDGPEAKTAHEQSEHGSDGGESPAAVRTGAGASEESDADSIPPRNNNSTTADSSSKKRKPGRVRRQEEAEKRAASEFHASLVATMQRAHAALYPAHHNVAALQMQQATRQWQARRRVQDLRDARDARAATTIQQVARTRQARKRVAERREDIAREVAAVKIQGQARQQQARRVVGQRRTEKGAATTIQNAQRAKISRRVVSEKREKRQQEVAATRIQSVQRAKSGRRVADAKREARARVIEEERAAATTIQQAARARRARTEVQMRREEQEAARQAAALLAAEEERRRHENAATKLQAVQRGATARAYVQQQQQAAAKLQAQQRGRAARAELQQKQQAASRLQALQRGHAARTKLESKHEAALRVQSVVRGKQARTRVHERKQSASEEQTTRADSAEGQAEQRAAIQLQALQRGHKARTDLEAQHNAATRVQSVVRGRQARVVTGENKAVPEAGTAQKEAATKLQAVQRGQSARHKLAKQRDAAQRVQSVVRGNQGRSKATAARHERQAVLKIQAASRGHLSRANRRKRRQKRHDAAAEAAAAAAIQRAVRSKQARSKVETLRKARLAKGVEESKKNTVTLQVPSPEEHSAATNIQRVARGHTARRASQAVHVVGNQAITEATATDDGASAGAEDAATEASEESISPLEALWVAAEENDVEIIEELRPLLEDGSLDLNAVDGEGFTAAMLAAHYGHLNFLDALMEFEPDMEIVGKDGSSALLLAAFNGHTDIVDLLLMDAGVNILQRLPNGMTALHIAIQQGHLGVVEVIVDAEEELRNQFEADGEVFGGAVVHLADKSGNTPLHLAIKAGALPVVDILLEVPTCPLATLNMEGETPVVLCVKMGMMDGLSALRGEGKLPRHQLRGGDILAVDAADVSGKTALDYAAAEGDTDMVRFLMRDLEASPTLFARNQLVGKFGVGPRGLSALGFPPEDPELAYAEVEEETTQGGDMDDNDTFEDDSDVGSPANASILSGSGSGYGGDSAFDSDYTDAPDTSDGDADSALDSEADEWEAADPGKEGVNTDAVDVD